MSGVEAGRPAVVARPRSPTRRRGRLLAAAIVGGVVLIGGGYFVTGYLAYQQLSVVHLGCAGRSFSFQTPADFEAYTDRRTLVVDASAYRFTDFETVAFPSRASSLTIRGWYAPGPRAGAGPAVVLVHGKGSCRRDPNVMLPAGMLHKAGFAVLLIDLRNHGESDSDNGRWAGGNKEYRDVLGAWDWLVAQGHDPRHIGLFGASLGAATVTIATGEEARVAATWADSPYADIGSASAEYAEENGYPGWVGTAAIAIGRIVGDAELGTKSPDDEVAKLDGRPFAIVEGLGDTTVRPHQAVDLAAAAFAGGTKVEPWIVPGAGHTEAMFVKPEEYEQRLVDFFATSIGPP